MGNYYADTHSSTWAHAHSKVMIHDMCVLKQNEGLRSPIGAAGCGLSFSPLSEKAHSDYCCSHDGWGHVQYREFTYQT